MHLDPLGKNLFMFTNKRKNILKILYWDKNGFCLWMKHLIKMKFPWTEEDILNREISHEEIKWLLAGIDFFHKHERLKYSGIN
jgi:transposase